MKRNALNIPRKIWTFWNTKDLPPTVHNCVKTWEFFNPGYEIHIINTKNVNKWIPEAKINKLHHGKESFARLSDFIRLNLLYKYGGIWLDASTICTQSFDDFFESVHKKNKHKKINFVGFYNDLFTTKPKYKVIESWAFACTRQNKFMKKWRDEFMELEDYDEVQDWLDDMEEMGVDFQDIPEYDDPDYLAIHIAVQKVLQYDKYSQKDIFLLKAEDTALKYRLYRPGNLSVAKKVERLCKDYKMWSSTPIIKFTGEDRKAMEKNRKVRNCVFNNWKNTVATMLTGVVDS